MKRIILLGIVLSAIGVLVTSATAGTIAADAVISATPDGSRFDYTIELTNTGGPTADKIETFWFAWVPGKDFMQDSPTNITTPTGWTANITHVPNIPTNGYAIQFVTSTAPLAPGQSTVFKFSSIDTTTQLAADSVFYPGTPVGTSFVYSGAPFVGDSLQFLVASVPEPSTLTLGLLGLASGVILRPRRKGEG